jgi:DinB family protein
MQGRPEPTEAAEYYFRYIDQVQGEEILVELEAQLDEMLELLDGVTEERSLHRYGPDKWSIREMLNHVTDTERVFVFRALWFARGFDAPLPGFDQNVAAPAARADEISWARHVEDFQAVRRATLSLFRNLPAEAWMRGGIASDNPVTVRALAYITAGHVEHHAAILRERYL